MPALPFRIMGLDKRGTTNNNNSSSNPTTPLPTHTNAASAASAAAANANNSSTTANTTTSRFTYPGNRGGGSTNTTSTSNNNHNNMPRLFARSGNAPSSSSSSQHLLDASMASTNSAPANMTASSSLAAAGAANLSNSAPLHSNTNNNNNNTNNNNNVVLRGANVDPPGGTLGQSRGLLPSAPYEQPQQQQQQQQYYSNTPNTNSGSQSSIPPQPPTDPSSSSFLGGRSTASANSNGSAESKTNRPGAYQVTRTSTGPAQVYRVTVPDGVRSGTEFTVHAGARRVRVRCPTTSRAGQSLQITLPPETVTNYLALRAAPLTAAVGSGGGGAVAMSREVERVNAQAKASGGTAQTYLVTIPPNVYPGQQFMVNVAGQKFMVSCPESAGPNMRVRIVPPVVKETPEAAPKTQVFEVAVPQGVQPGQPFALVANGQRVLVTCPPDVVPGQKIRFQLPVSQVVGNIQLAYESEKGGWKRTIRVTDLKFQWVRLEGIGENAKDKDSGGGGQGDLIDLEASSHFDFMKSAYVRKITYMEGNDARMRTGTIELAPASEAVVDSRLIVQNQTLLSYADIAQTQGKPLEEKKAWFKSICQRLSTPWEEGHVKICVRRSHLLLDSVDAIMGLGREDLRHKWRIEFLGEPAIDAGGPTKEWFELVTEQVYDPACGLWIPSANNQACVDINPASEMSCPEDHLIYFRFVGRVVGRALFDDKNIKGHMVRMIYKHLLGWPITFEDVKAQDEEYYQSLKKLTTMDDVSLMCLDFTATEETLGMRVEKELIEGGAMKEVTNENLHEYLEANIRYRMFNRTLPQLTELLLGFYDVVPEPALTVFDANELELILCGLPEINLEDWQANTCYKGEFEISGRSHQVVQWFWEVVRDEFDQEMRARLLQFSTGTSGVPLGGFAMLQGIDGNIKQFTIQGVDTRMFLYPKSHTCFNRIDLPLYDSKADLHEKLKIAVTTSYVGFDTE